MASNGWNKYQKLVLRELEDNRKMNESLSSEIKSIRVKDIPALQVEIGALKVKAGIWGALAGLIPAGVAALLWKKP